MTASIRFDGFFTAFSQFGWGVVIVLTGFDPGSLTHIVLRPAMTRFETLIDQYHDEIYRYLWRLLPGAGQAGAVGADDLTQEVFLRAYRSFSRLRAGSNYRAWLYKIATNCAYTTLKRAGREVDLEDFDRLASHDGHPEKRVIDREATLQLHSLLDELPPKQQAAVVMRYLQELSYAEIAQALDCSEDSARANVYQGIRRLRRESAQDGPEELSDGR
jgi:RNA polymerase sigma-70 factor (ECF subfamily)